VQIDPEWRQRMTGIYDDLLADIDAGSFWDPYLTTLRQAARRLVS
jgi:hypothetical protein